MAENDRFLQRLADLTGVEVVRPVNTETTAWGAAFLAGLGAGMFASLEEGRALCAAPRLRLEVPLAARAAYTARAYADAARRLKGEEVPMSLPVERKSFLDKLFMRRAA